MNNKFPLLVAALLLLSIAPTSRGAAVTYASDSTASATLSTATVTPATDQSFFTFTSSPNSWVGHGASETDNITSANRYFSLGAYSNTVYFYTTNGWSLYFAGPSLTLPTVGYYPNAQRWAFNGSSPGLTFSGNGRGDNTSTGSFNVLEAAFDTSGNVTRYAVDFTQYDEGAPSAWNTGSIRYNSSIPVPAPEPTATLLALTGLTVSSLRRRKTHNAMLPSRSPSTSRGGL